MNIENHNNSFNEILTLIQQARKRAYLQTNKVLMELYWSVGKYVSNKTSKESWGKGVVKELAEYIQQQDPIIGGFTPRNIWRMKQFYETYRENLKLTPLVSQISWTNNLIILSGNRSDEEKEFYLGLLPEAKELASKLELDSEN